jgi:hypothetical protein
MVCLGARIAYQQIGLLPGIIRQGFVLQAMLLHICLLISLERLLKLLQLVVLCKAEQLPTLC